MLIEGLWPGAGLLWAAGYCITLKTFLCSPFFVRGSRLFENVRALRVTTESANPAPHALRVKVTVAFRSLGRRLALVVRYVCPFTVLCSI